MFSSACRDEPPDLSASISKYSSSHQIPSGPTVMRCLFASPLMAGEWTPGAEAAGTKNDVAMGIMRALSEIEVAMQHLADWLDKRNHLDTRYPAGQLRVH